MVCALNCRKQSLKLLQGLQNGWSPLLFASSNGHHEFVQILLQNNSRIDVFDDFGMTALHLAAEKGHILVAEVLLAHKSFVNAKSKSGLTPLHLAAQNGYKNLVEILVKKYNASIDGKTLNGKTALHLAAEFNQKSVCELFLNDKSFLADTCSVDYKGQTPMHLAAKNDHPEIVKLFLKHKPELLVAVNLEGMNCVHLAAANGSLSVIQEFMRFNKFIIHGVRNKSSGSTPLHLATEGGHLEIVKTLLDAGANSSDENNDGMTCIHVAAKYGHVQLLECLKDKINLKTVSNKTGMTPIHIASHYGQMDFVREMLNYVSPNIRSERPKTGGQIKDLLTESGLTPLHLAAQSGHENLIRLLLNYNGVDVDPITKNNGTIPLHFAAQNGHTNVTSLLLGKSASQITKKDFKGRTSLHYASSCGHFEMVALFIGQGGEINGQDNMGFTPLHYAAKSGNLQVCKLLVESGAKCEAKTNDFKIPLLFAAKFNHIDVVSYLFHNKHCTEMLMNDNKFLYDLMICSKLNNFKSVDEFILLSTTPVETAAKLSKHYSILSEKEKERSKDLLSVSKHCETMCIDLVALAAYESGADKLLKSYGQHEIQFLDILIETEQKEVISHPSVQKYLSIVWKGNLNWPTWKFLLLFLVLSFPFTWLYALFPKGRILFKSPIIKFVVYLFSHIFLTIILVMVANNQPFNRKLLFPTYFEWLLFIWLVGVLLSELVNPVDRSNIAVLRILILIFSIIAILIHFSSYFIRTIELAEIIYIRNQILGASTFLCFVATLDFLSFHHLFGPWTIIIRDLMVDLFRFLVIFIIFLFAFASLLSVTFQPIVLESENSDNKPTKDIIDMAILLYFSLYGLVEPDDLPNPDITPKYSDKLSRFIFAFAMLMIIIVLVNLFIAMMSDTYQRIQAQSDIEWKFGRAKLIRNMKHTIPVPSPFIIIYQVWYYILLIYYKIRNIPFTKFTDDEIDDPEHKLRRKSQISPNIIEATQSLKSGSEKLEDVVNWPDIVKKYLAIRDNK